MATSKSDYAGTAGAVLGVVGGAVGVRVLVGGGGVALPVAPVAAVSTVAKDAISWTGGTSIARRNSRCGGRSLR